MGNPVRAILYNHDGDPVSLDEPAIQGVLAITPSDSVPVAAGRAFLVVCTVAGNVKIEFVDGSTLTFAVAVGLSELPWAVIRVFVTGTTAIATYANGQ